LQAVFQDILVKETTHHGYAKKKVEQRREEIIPALLSLVQEQGQKGLSVSAVARRIGLVPSAIYRHFKDRDAMIEGVAEYVATQLAENIAAAGGDGRYAEEKLRRLLDRHIAMIRSNPGLLRIVFSDELFGGNPLTTSPHAPSHPRVSRCGGSACPRGAGRW
jgi:AcrR family transcriptional regulator